MNAQSQDTVTFLLSTLTALLVLTGLAVRFVLLPWLRDHLVDPVQQTHQQVSANGRDTEPPTLPDRLADLQSDVSVLTRLLDTHVEWSTEEHDRLDKALEELVKQRRGRRHD